VTDATRWPFEVIGAGFAILAVAVIVYGALRFIRVERALDAGTFARLEAPTAITLAAAAAVLGVVTLVIVFVH
jgi:uncharacterized membrane protein YidH (DUF202 family)